MQDVITIALAKAGWPKRLLRYWKNVGSIAARSKIPGAGWYCGMKRGRISLSWSNPATCHLCR